jgi:hypothetical protein
MVNYRMYNCQTQGETNRVMFNNAILTTAECNSQAQPSCTLGRHMASYCKLVVITSTGKFTAIVCFKESITFNTFFSEQIVQ